MTDSIDFLTEIKKEDFPKLYTSPQIVQDVLSQFEKHIQISMQQHYYTHVNGKKEKDDYLKDINLLKRCKERLLMNKKQMEVCKIPANKREVEREYQEINANLKKIEIQIKKHTPADFTGDLLTAKYTKMIANGIENLGYAIGEWFETGAVGPGTVTFQDRTFTAQ